MAARVQPQNNLRRLSCCVIPAGHYSFDTVLLIRARSIPLFTLLGIVNSDLWEWRFRCTSMTNHVNEYEIGNLAVPLEFTDVKNPISAALQQHAKAANHAKTPGIRRSEQQLTPANSIDLLIDKIVFDAYGVSEADQRVIRESLKRQATVRTRRSGDEA